jgi:cellulose synthase operon protein C
MFKPRSRQLNLLALVASISLVLVFTAGCNRDPNVRKRKYLESGKRYEQADKLKEAAIQFSNALKVDKNYADAHYELGKVYLKLGGLREAYTEFSHAVDLAPNNLPARIDLAQMFLAGNAPDKAEEQAKAVLAIDPNNADAYAVMANVAARHGDRGGALSNIQRALAIRPNEAVFHTTLALIDNTDPLSEPAAEQELLKAISLDPKDAHAHVVLAAMLERKGDKQGAEQQYIAAVQAAPKDMHPRASLAGLYLRNQDQPKAEQTLRKAVEDIPDSDEASELLKDYYFRIGQPDTAETVFAGLTSKYSKSFPIKMNYAAILAARGEFAKVAPIADQLSKTNGSQPQVQLLKSALLLNSGKVNDAFDLLQNAVKNDVDNVQLLIGLAKVAALKGDLAVATKSYRQAEKMAPQNLEIQEGLAGLANKANDASMLAAVADKTIAMRPDFAPGYLWRGTAEASLKQYDKAEVDLQTAATKNPNGPGPYTALGELRLRQGQLPQGVAMLEKALEKDPNEVSALNDIVAVQLHDQQADKAVARIQQQIAKSPKNPAYYSMLGVVQLGTKDYNGARDSSKKALDLNPSDERSVDTYARAVGSLGNRDEAIAVWQKWVDAHPKDAVALRTMGLFQDEKGDHVAAVEDYKRALQIDPGEGLAANNLAYAMVTSGQNVDLALSYAQTARRVFPDSPNTADTLAWVYYYKGTYLSARDLLEMALKQSPNDASINYHLGMTYSKLGRKADAQTYLKKAISVDPNSQVGKDAAAALAKLG